MGRGRFAADPYYDEAVETILRAQDELIALARHPIQANPLDVDNILQRIRQASVGHTDLLSTWANALHALVQRAPHDANLFIVARLQDLRDEEINKGV